jgi:DNA-binding transcriptional regulator/RsmH inhibitor MraZ
MPDNYPAEAVEVADPRLNLPEESRTELSNKLTSIVSAMTALTTNDNNRLVLPTSARDSLVIQLEEVIAAMKALAPVTAGGRRSHKKRHTKRRRSRRHPK